jgi:hypothetical protein
MDEECASLGIGSVHTNPSEALEPQFGEILDVDRFYQRLIFSFSPRLNSRRVGAVDMVDQSNSPFHSGNRRPTVSPQDLAEWWLIGLHQGKETLRHTTQRVIRSGLLPLSRRYKADGIYTVPRLRGLVLPISRQAILNQDIELRNAYSWVLFRLTAHNSKPPIIIPTRVTPPGTQGSTTA